MKTNIIFKVQMEEVQDKIAGITLAIATGVMYQDYKAGLLPRLDVLVQKRDNLMSLEKRKGERYDYHRERSLSATERLE